VVVARARNESDQPVYRINYSWSLGHQPIGGFDGPDPLLPGAEDSNVREIPDGAPAESVTAVISFRDSAGVRWRKRADGQFEEIPVLEAG
jgi:hypothetical protein